jgi:hypothetical protein
VNATTEFIEQGIAPLGLLAGGVLGQWLGPRFALSLGAAGSVLGTGWLLFLLRNGRSAPEPNPNPHL